MIVCLQSTRSPVATVNEQKVTSIIVHIVTVLFVLHWLG
jgi:hypothetical protein